MKKLLLLCLVLLGGVMQVSATEYKVTVIDGKGWISGDKKMCAYMWNSSNGNQRNADFPGAEMTSNGTRTINGVACNVYTYTVTSDNTYDKVIFAVSDKSNQTGTLDYTSDMECTLYADRDVYLVNNLNNWNTSDDNYKSKGVWDGTQDVYQFTISGANLTTNQFQFRPKASDWGDQMSPSGSNHNFSNFSLNGKWASYDSYSNNNGYKDQNYHFDIDHPNIKANEYKITVYIQYKKWDNVDGRLYTTKVEIVDMPVTISSAGKATFSCNRALDFTGTGINAYMISDACDGALTLSGAMTVVPARTGLYLEGSEGTINVPVVTIDDDYEDYTFANLLVPGANKAVAATSDGYTNFILTNKTTSGSAPLKFYKANGNTVPVGKAYLQIPTHLAGARESFWFDNEATGIANVDVNANFDADAPMYNLAGQRVGKNYKGVVIQNGKKMLMK